MLNPIYVNKIPIKRYFSSTKLLSANRELNMQFIKMKMDSVLLELQSDLLRYVIGRPNPTLIEELKFSKLKEPVSKYAKVLVRDNTSLQVKGRDGFDVGEVENAIHALNLGIATFKEGPSILTLTFPKPSLESRNQLAKVVRESSEKYRIKIREIRKDLLKDLQREMTTSISKDIQDKYKNTIQKEHDECITKISKEIAKKIKEIETK